MKHSEIMRIIDSMNASPADDRRCFFCSKDVTAHSEDCLWVIVKRAEAEEDREGVA
jgi:hypothetical protein